MPTKAPTPLKPLSTRQLGLWVLFASLSMLFGASLVGYFITRFQNPVWRAPGSVLPSGLAMSTACLLGVSLCMHCALTAISKNHIESLKTWLRWALVSACCYLATQSLNWRMLTLSDEVTAVRSLYAFTFFMLTGLHALHVVGGLVPLSLVLIKAERHSYSSSHHEGVKLCVQYWHFLGIIWVILLTSLLLAT